MRRILGISAFYHDSAACIVIDGEIIAAVQEERFTRKKHTEKFPVNAISYCLKKADLTLDQLDAVVYYEKPFLKFERLLSTYYEKAPKGLISFIKAMPIWIKEKLFFKRFIKKHLESVEIYNKKKLNLLFTTHHFSHAASAFYASPFNSAAILTIDGVGEWETVTISEADNSGIRQIKSIRFPHSIGLLYSSFTYFLGFKVNSGEYKLMGLAPYGNDRSDNYKNFVSIIEDKLVRYKDDGSFILNQEHFNYETGLRMIKDEVWEDLFGIKKRNADTEILQIHCDLALAIQRVTENLILNLAKEVKRISNNSNLCLAGGVALNCVANGKIQALGIFENIFIQPAAGDAGGALGAALGMYYMDPNNTRDNIDGKDKMKGSLLGPEYTDLDVENLIKEKNENALYFDDFNQLCQHVSQELQKSKIVGWFQGRSEFGPRALGNRSILADPRPQDAHKRLNLEIKFREEFRPFAPAILKEYCDDYFELSCESPYMLFVSKVRSKWLKEESFDYSDKPLLQKLHTSRGQIDAITHVDYSARIQTVDKERNLRFHTLISSFNDISSCPILVNTSFNVRGEPIVNTPEEAYNCFMKTGMDVLVINNHVFTK